MVSMYYPNVDNITVIFWDLNNLKHINDEYGHAFGDKAIEKISALLNAHSSERCRIYRVGGDEFLLIIDNPNENEAQDIIKDVKDKLDKYNESATVKVSGAVGYATGCGRDIAEIEKTADARMYEDKRLSKEGRI